jgi:hypothetical protein
LFSVAFGQADSAAVALAVELTRVPKGLKTIGKTPDIPPFQIARHELATRPVDQVVSVAFGVRGHVVSIRTSLLNEHMNGTPHAPEQVRNCCRTQAAIISLARQAE